MDDAESESNWLESRTFGEAFILSEINQHTKRSRDMNIEDDDDLPNDCISMSICASTVDSVDLVDWPRRMNCRHCNTATTRVKNVKSRPIETRAMFISSNTKLFCEACWTGPGCDSL